MRTAALILTLLAPASTIAHDTLGRYGYGPYYDGYAYGFPYYSPRTEVELARIREELRAQRRRSALQDRDRGNEIEALRDQANTRYQVSAAQACYYRTVGGMELCEDLYEAGSDDFARCEKLVQDRNPGCSLTR